MNEPMLSQGKVETGLEPCKPFLRRDTLIDDLIKKISFYPRTGQITRILKLAKRKQPKTELEDWLLPRPVDFELIGTYNSDFIMYRGRDCASILLKPKLWYPIPQGYRAFFDSRYHDRLDEIKEGLIHLTLQGIGVYKADYNHDPFWLDAYAEVYAAKRKWIWSFIDPLLREQRRYNFKYGPLPVAINRDTFD